MTPLYKKLENMQENKTDNRNIYMKSDKGIKTLYHFSHQLPCGEKIYQDTITKEHCGLDELIVWALDHLLDQEEAKWLKK